MGLYGFKKQFADPILSGRKKHTIRAPRKHPDKPGNKMHLYTGLRQKGARLLMVGVCTKVEDIRITLDEIFVDDEPLTTSEMEQLAKCDGFTDLEEMMSFWDGNLPFTGQIFHWKRMEG
jgi:hypothetical protein